MEYLKKPLDKGSLYPVRMSLNCPDKIKVAPQLQAVSWGATCAESRRVLQRLLALEGLTCEAFSREYAV